MSTLQRPGLYEPWAVVIALALVAFLSLSAVEASRVRPVNLEEMTDHAARIVTGRCTEVRAIHDPALDAAVTEVTLDVERTLKGDESASMTFRMLGGAAPGDPAGKDVAGLPRFAPGEKVILFLYGESDSGLTSPVGLGQGKFVVVEDKHGREVALNGAGNRVLLDRLSPEADGRIGGLAREWKGRDGIPPGTLIEMVETLLP